jgi:citrate synthase
VVAEKIPAQQERLKAIKKTYGDKVIGDVTVGMCIGGMRGIQGMLWETSLLDPEDGIRFRGYTIPECQKQLPSAIPGGEPIPEGMLWLLMTGEMPTKEQVAQLSSDLRLRSELPPHVAKVLEAMPADTHPMTQFTQAILALQTNSEFAAAYARGIHKSEFWKPYFEDSMDLIAKLPGIASLIYRRTYHQGKLIEADPNLDWAANLSHMMGYDSTEAMELMRLYQTIHSDHEGGNVSAHTTHLVGSALSDPYLSFAAGMTGLAGPLHGLANQEVLNWLEGVVKDIGLKPTDAQLEEYINNTLNSGRVVPG